MTDIAATNADISIVSQGPRRISRRRKIAYTIVCLAVFLLLCEGAVRIRAWIRFGAAGTSVGGDDMLAWDSETGLRIPRPGYQVTGQRHSIRINSLGFRGNEITVAKPPNTIRIACVGGSTTFCTGVTKNEAAWPQLLQDKLQQEYPAVTIEVINAGVPGYCTVQSLENLRKRVLPLEPDLVIFYEAHNEMAHDTLPLAQERGLVQGGETHLSPVARFLSHSLLFDLIYKNARIAVGTHSDTPTGKLYGLPSDLTSNYVKALGAMHQATAERGSAFLLSTFIVKYRRDQPKAEQIANADIGFYYMPWMSIDGLLDGTDAYNAAVKEYGRAHGVPVVDDRECIPADAEHFVDCVHLADKGCEVMADRFYRFFKQEGLVYRLIEGRRE